MKKVFILLFILLNFLIIQKSFGTDIIIDYNEYNPFTNQPDATISTTTIVDLSTNTTGAFLRINGSTPLTANWNAGSFKITQSSIASSGNLDLIPSGETDNYLRWSVVSNVPTLTVIGNVLMDIKSNSASSVGINIKEDSSNYGQFLWSKTGNNFSVFSTSDFDILTESDVNDFVRFETAANQSTMRFFGQNGSIIADGGLIDFDNEWLQTSGKIDGATLDTGQGDNELYDMDQNVLTTSDVTFAMGTFTDAVESASMTVTGQYTFPLDSPADNEIIKFDAGTNALVWEADSGGGGGSPGGANTEVQYNDSGAFNGIADLTYDNTDLLLGGTAGTTKLQIRDSGIYINSPDDGVFDFVADDKIVMKASSTVSYVEFDFDGTNPVMDIIGGIGVQNITSDNATTVGIQLTEDSLNNLKIRWNKSNSKSYFLSTSEMDFFANGDGDDYIEYSVDGSTPTIDGVGTNNINMPVKLTVDELTSTTIQHGSLVNIVIGDVAIASVTSSGFSASTITVTNDITAGTINTNLSVSDTSDDNYLVLPGGNNDYFRANQTVLGGGVTEFSVFVWIKTSDTGDSVIMESRDSSSPNNGFTIRKVSNYLRFLVDTSAGVAQPPGASDRGAIDDGDWHHIGALWTGTSIYMTVDGVVSSSTDTLGGTMTKTAQLRFGKATQTATDEFVGNMDNVMVFSVDVGTTTAKEIFDLGRVITSYSGTDSANLDHHWPFITIEDVETSVNGILNGNASLFTLIGWNLNSSLKITGSVEIGNPQTYTVTNVITDRVFNANSTNTAELADVLGTLIQDLKSAGLVR